MAAALGASTAAPPARAWHDAEQHVTDDTAYTLRRHEFRVGLWKAEVGIWKPVTVGTYLWPWLFTIGSFHGKWRFLDAGPVSVAAGLGVMWFDTRRLKQLDSRAGSAQVSAVPLELVGSYRLSDRFTVSTALAYTAIRLKGEVNSDAFEGAVRGAADNWQGAITAEWRANRVVALLAQWRTQLFERMTVGGRAAAHPDRFTTVEIVGAARTRLEWSGWSSFGLASVASWQHFNLRVGVVGGHYDVAGLNVMTGNFAVVPEFDVYWLF
jgi:hypothetical protein